MKNKDISKSSYFKKTAVISIIATIIAVVAINIVSSFWFYRLDLTQDKRHSLSQSTIDLIKNLDDVVYIKVYMPGKDLPVEYQQIVTRTRELLEELSSYSSNIKYEMTDPTEGKSKEDVNAIYAELYQKGLAPIPIREEYAAGKSTRYVVPGAIISYKNRETAATLVEEDLGRRFSIEDYSYMRLEYNLMLAIKSLVKPHKSTVAFIDGHGELDIYHTLWASWKLGMKVPPLDEVFPSNAKKMGSFYTVTRDSINGKINSLRKIAIEDSLQGTVRDLGNKYDVLVIAQPTRYFSDKDKYAIDQHIMRGGKVIWFIDATNAAIDSLEMKSDFMALPAALRLDDMFFKYGVRLNSNLIQDIASGSCRAIPQSAISDKMMIYPYALSINHFENHPINTKITALNSFFAGSIDFVGKDDHLKKTVLATSSDSSKVVSVPAIVTKNAGLIKPGFKEFSAEKQPMAVLVEGKFYSAFDGILPIEFDTIKQFNFLRESKETKQIFIADGDMIRNYFDLRQGPAPTGYDIYTGKYYDNTEFFINCVDYLCGNTDLIELRSKTFQIGVLDKNMIGEKKVRNLYQFINILLPLFVIALIGLALTITRKVRYSRRTAYNRQK